MNMIRLKPPQCPGTLLQHDSQPGRRGALVHESCYVDGTVLVMTFVVLVMTYVCMDINGVSNTELGLPSPVDGWEAVKVTLDKKSKWHWSKMQIWIQEHWTLLVNDSKEAPFLWHLEIQITWSYLALPWMVMNPMSWEKRQSLTLEHKITESLWNSRHQCHQYNVTKSIFQYLHLQSEEECKK